MIQVKLPEKLEMSGYHPGPRLDFVIKLRLLFGPPSWKKEGRV